LALALRSALGLHAPSARRRRCSPGLTKASVAFARPTLRLLRRAADGGRHAPRKIGLRLGLCRVALPEYVFAGHRRSHRVRGAGEQALMPRSAHATSDGRDLVRRAAFQEPAPASSWLDPRWLAAIPLGAVLAWRTATGLYARKAEAAWWIGAAAAWAPVSQIFPFLNPIADRYLYFMLPGLIGGASLWLACAGALGARRSPPRSPPSSPWSRRMARLWRDEACCCWMPPALPDGATAHAGARRAAIRRTRRRVELREACARARSLRGVRPGPGARADRDTPEFGS
jgi:hypothetical protein